MPIFTCVKSFTNFARRSAALLLAAALLFAGVAHADWSVDFSRRARAIRETDLSNAAQAPAREKDRSPASQSFPAAQVSPLVQDKEVAKGVFDTLFDAGEPVQDIVILNTEKGFVPSVVRVRKNGRYRISVVNVNEKEKNISFILDGFSEHHATYYGKVKTFFLDAKKEGQFSFQSPETASEGKLIVFNPQVSLRAPAQADAGAPTQEGPR